MQKCACSLYPRGFAWALGIRIRFLTSARLSVISPYITNVVAPDTGEMAAAASQRETFKAFVARRKGEYRSKFPFLTDSQVVAKLKRLWKSQQAREVLSTEKSELRFTFLCKFCYLGRQKR